MEHLNCVFCKKQDVHTLLDHLSSTHQSKPPLSQTPFLIYGLYAICFLVHLCLASWYWSVVLFCSLFIINHSCHLLTSASGWAVRHANRGPTPKHIGQFKLDTAKKDRLVKNQNNFVCASVHVQCNCKHIKIHFQVCGTKSFKLGLVMYKIIPTCTCIVHFVVLFMKTSNSY